MKPVLKFLFAAVALFTLCNLNYPDAATAFTCIGAGTCLVTACVVPPQYWFTGHLNIGGLPVEVWKKYIIEKFRKDNAFMFMSKDDSSNVLGGAVVHIPQAGADPVIVKNRSVYPATAVRRTDTDITYVLDTYSTDPTHITWAEIQDISYAKLDSILGNQTRSLGENCGR